MPGSPVCAPDWLALREGADAAARSSELAERVSTHVAGDAPTRISDLGCGTGSMGRWLAGRLPGPQHWTLHDRDPGLLALARAAMPAVAADGAPVTTRAREGDLTGLRAADLTGASLVTASALLDLLTSEEVEALAAVCADAGCAALLTLTVVGHVEITPSEPEDGAFAAAFDAHQGRCADGRRLLGPDAGPVAVEAFARRGALVEARPSPWRLDDGQVELAEEWLRGWVGAACEQQPDLAPQADDYLRRRLDAAAAGDLHIVVDHLDVLAVPAGVG